MNTSPLRDVRYKYLPLGSRLYGAWVHARGRLCVLLFAVATVSAACGVSRPSASSPAITAAPAPKPSVVEGTAYLSDVARADPVLGSYIRAWGNVALRALLTDGSAFCAFLAQGDGIDHAMTSLLVGANSDESKTHLPRTVTTYNTIDAVALTELCPTEAITRSRPFDEMSTCAAIVVISSGVG